MPPANNLYTVNNPIDEPRVPDRLAGTSKARVASAPPFRVEEL